VEFARSKRSSSKMNGTKRSLTFNIVARCVTGEDKERSSASMKRIKSTPNPQARRPRVAHGHGIAARDVTSKSDEDEEEGVEWGKRMYGVRMSPAHPRYIGRGDETCGGEVVYTIQEIRKLLRSQPEDVKRWLTTSQMGWALTREDNGVTNEKDILNIFKILFSLFSFRIFIDFTIFFDFILIV
jgi:hypothetical protein